MRLWAQDETRTWRDDAKCKGLHPDLFFGPKGRNMETVKEFCADCTVKDRCLAEALNNTTEGDGGVWGGTTPQERKRLRRDYPHGSWWRRAIGCPCPTCNST